MRSILFFFCVTIVLQVVGQTAVEIRNAMWGPDFNENFGKDEIREEWLDNSVVVLAKYIHHEYHRPFMASLLRKTSFRLRMKLLSQKAIDEYGTITFDQTQGSNLYYHGLKVIKPDGEEQIVDTRAIGKVTDLQFYGTSRKQLKVAIPNLEVGDIVDYYVYRHSEYLPSMYIPFDPIIYEFSSQYPIKYQRLSFDISRKVYINLRSMNGAPELTKNESEESDEYFVEMFNSEPIELEPFMFPYRQLPYLKIKVSYVPNAAVGIVPFIGSPAIPKTKIRENELKAYIKRQVETSAAKGHVKLKKYFKQSHKGVVFEPDSLFRLAYYKLRHLRALPRSATFFLNDREPYLFTYEQFNAMKGLSKFLDKQGIENHYFVSVPRNFTTLDNVAFAEELVFGLHVNTGTQEYFVSEFGFYGTPESSDPAIEGSEGLFWKMGEGYIPVTFREELSISPPEVNVHETDLKVQVDLSGMVVSVRATKRLQGAFKTEMQSQLVDYFDDVGNETAKFGPIPTNENISTRELKEYYQRRDDKKINAVLSQVRDELEFEVDTVTSVSLQTTGRFGEPLTYSFNLETNELLSTAGPNKILHVGKLLEKPLEEELDEAERQFHIYQEFARTIRYNILIEVPPGYEVQGLDELNASVKNETGAFTVEASESQGAIALSVQKTHSHVYEPQENWNLMFDFLQAASEFQSAKLLLRKVPN